MSVVSVLTLPVRAGAEEAIARAYDEAEIFEHSRRSGGFLGARLLRPLRVGDPFLVIAEWESEDDYRRWLDNPIRESIGARIAPHLTGEVGAGALYEDAQRP
jgi:heme-degrading monooxygenase HmoA